jgi:hypothetical protein
MLNGADYPVLGGSAFHLFPSHKVYREGEGLRVGTGLEKQMFRSAQHDKGGHLT